MVRCKFYFAAGIIIHPRIRERVRAANYRGGAGDDIFIRIHRDGSNRIYGKLTYGIYTYIRIYMYIQYIQGYLLVDTLAGERCSIIPQK